MRRAALLLASALLLSGVGSCRAQKATPLKKHQVHLTGEQAKAMGFTRPPTPEADADPIQPRKGTTPRSKQPRKSTEQQQAERLHSRAQKLLDAEAGAQGVRGAPAEGEAWAALSELLRSESQLGTVAERYRLVEDAAAAFLVNRSAMGALAVALSHSAPMAMALFGVNATTPLPEDVSEAGLLRFASQSQGVAGDLAKLALGWRHLSTGRGVERDCHVAVADYYLSAAVSSVRAADRAATELRATGFPSIEEVWLWDDWLVGFSRARQSAEKVAALRSKADGGDAAARLMMAELYFYGDNPAVPLDESKALESYRAASEEGSARAAHNLALILQRGGGTGDVAVDVAEAAEMLGKAARQGYNPAMTELGKQLLRDESHAEEGLQMLDLGAAAGDPEAHSALFQVYSKGAGEVKPNMTKALQHLEDAATFSEPYTHVSLTSHFALGEAHWRHHLALRSELEALSSNVSAADVPTRGELLSAKHAEMQEECAVAAEHLKYVAEGGAAGRAVQDAYWAHSDSQPWTALIGYAWGASLGFDLAHAALAHLMQLGETRSLLGCEGAVSKSNSCDRARVALLRRLVNARAREGDGAGQSAVGRRLPAEPVAALARGALEIANEPGLAFGFYSQAARMGSAAAMAGLAGMYETGVDTPDLTVAANQTMAVELFGLAVERVGEADVALKVKAQALLVRAQAKLRLGVGGPDEAWLAAVALVVAGVLFAAVKCCCGGKAAEPPKKKQK